MNGQAELWRKFVAGDLDAFKEIYVSNVDRLYNYGLAIAKEPEAVKDAISQVFVDLYEKRASIDITDSISAYLTVCFRRKLLKNISSGSLRGMDKLDDVSELKLTEDVLSREMEILDVETTEGNHRALKEAMTSLTPQQREVLYLKYYEGYSIEEISKLLSVSIRTVYNVSFNALKRLRDDMKPSRNK